MANTLTPIGSPLPLVDWPAERGRYAVKFLSGSSQGLYCAHPNLSENLPGTLSGGDNYDISIIGWVKFNAAGLSSGIYFYKIHAGDFIETKKMLLMK